MPFTLILTKQAADELRAHASDGYPYEVVGVMAGTQTGDFLTVDRTFRADNRLRLIEEQGDAAAGKSLKEALGFRSDDSSANRFLMTGEDVLKIQNLCRREGRDILGFYHSHPDHPAEPSDTDLRFAGNTIPGYIYVIVSVRNGIPTEITGWLLSDDTAAFAPVTVRLGP